MKNGKFSIRFFFHATIIEPDSNSSCLLFRTTRTHPYFISIEKYAELIEATGLMNTPTTADWNEQTIASWRHSIWVGVYDPRGFIFKPTKYYKCVRDAYCLERMHRAFDRGLMQYGMFAATKKDT